MPSTEGNICSLWTRPAENDLLSFRLVYYHFVTIYGEIYVLYGEIHQRA